MGLRDPIPHSVAPPSDLLPPFIPDLKTLHQALNADSLPPNCAGALLDEPGDTLVKALRQLHAVYFSFYPNQPPSPSPAQSPSPSSFNPQSSICNLQSGTPQSDAPSIHPVHPVHPVNPVNPVHAVQSVEPDLPQSEISNLKSEIPHSAFNIPHSTAPP